MPDDDVLSGNIEEYLEIIYKLSHGGERASTSKISENLKVAPASVTKMLKKLDEKGYVNYSPYKGASLTDKGLKVAKKITRKHRLLERFLYDILKIKKDRVHKEACEMEHSLSDESERALCQLLEHPDKCPDTSELIPACDLKFTSCEECTQKKGQDLEEVGKRSQNLVSIIDLGDGQKGRVTFIRGDHKVIRRLLDMGITVGTTITLMKSAPFAGPVEIAVRGSNLALGRGIATNVFVKSAGDIKGR